MTEEIATRCPACGGELTIRRRNSDDKEFLGCKQYETTGCKFTQEIPMDIKLRRAGAPILPGFD